MKSEILIACTLISVCTNLFGSSTAGVVFVDNNNNGIRDKNETGLKGVAVSDQVSVVLTDDNGFYRIMDTRGFGYVFISLPQGYQAIKYFKKIDPTSANSQVDFPLTKTSVHAEFKFIHASDTHISEASLDRMRKFQAVVDSIKPDFVLITGDLVKDALRVPEKEATSLYELYKKEILKISQTVWNVPGNHEIFGIERELSHVDAQHPLYGKKMYRSYLGPDYYSFNCGGIHFVGLNSVDYEDTGYYGSVDSVQGEWLKKDLAVLAPETPVVTFQHIPFLSGHISLAGFTESGPARTLENVKGKPRLRHVVSNAVEVIAILQSHPFPLALAGHHHSRQTYFLQTEGQQTRFEQTGAVVGPSAERSLKMPSGVTLYRVKDTTIDAGVFIQIK